MSTPHTADKLRIHTHLPPADSKEWVLKWPGQVVIAAGQIYWTKETEDALVSGGTAALGVCTPGSRFLFLFLKRLPVWLSSLLLLLMALIRVLILCCFHLLPVKGICVHSFFNENVKKDGSPESACFFVS